MAATSSATAALRERRLESGVGRWSEQRRTPYRFDEFLDLIGDGVELDASTTLAATMWLIRPNCAGVHHLGRAEQPDRAQGPAALWTRL